MPFLDVSDIVIDPDFADTFDVIRTTVSVSSGGVNQVSAPRTFRNVVGVVTADSGQLLNRLDVGERQTNSITVHTMFRLTTGNGSTDADQIVWNGATYTIANVADYSRFGAGFICATCDLKNINP